MRSISRTLTTAGVIAAVILIGLFFGWLAARPPAARRSSAAGAPLAGGSASATMRTNAPALVFHKMPAAAGDTNNVSVATSTNGAPLVTDWEEQIDTILRDNSDLDKKAREMLKLFPRMPPEGQVETAQHISNLLDDKDYPAFGKYVLNAKLPEEVLDVLLGDMLNRPNSVKMPLLLEVASNPDHPKAEEAKETLGLYLEEDYGTNWEVWQEKIGEWLKANPD